MIKSLTIILIGTLTMGLFNFLKKEKKTEPNQNSNILGMVLLNEPNSLEINKVVSELENTWNLELGESDISDETSIIDINGYRIAIATMPVPIPSDEVTSAAEYNYFWKNAVEETSQHSGHIILSIMNAGKDPVAENILFTQVASAVMKHSNSMGIYMGNRTLVLKKDFYLDNADIMSQDSLPLYIWIYFGLRSENGKQSVYTYGLADFGKKEIEILDSENTLKELSEMLFNLAHYVIAYDVTLQDGETIGFTTEQKLKVTESQGRYLEGNTLKIAY